jgi:two-component system nitrogen regulation sensor histidine kinase GlnL
MSGTTGIGTVENGRSDSGSIASDLLDGLPHPVLLLGNKNRIEFANAAAEHFFQSSATFLRRQTFDDIIAFGSPLLALIDYVRRTGTKVNEYGVDLGSVKDTKHTLVDVYGGPVAEADGKILVMLQQRTMAHMIERQLTHRGAARSVSGLAGVLAHEIKNPLSGIRGAAQLLESSLGDEDRQLTKLICDESDRICNLVDRMEVFGDERPLEREAVNIHDVLDHVKKIAEAGFAGNINLVENYDPSLPSISGSRDKLIQTFLNLVKNAAEAIGAERRDGQITLSTAFRPGVRLSSPGSAARVSLPLQIEIEDNGPGIPADLKPHLFEPFVTTKTSGSGLGLALVAKFIGDHGGSIECDSKSHGAIFRVLMPMYDASPEDSPSGGSDDQG